MCCFEQALLCCRKQARKLDDFGPWSQRAKNVWIFLTAVHGSDILLFLNYCSLTGVRLVFEQHFPAKNRDDFENSASWSCGFCSGFSNDESKMGDRNPKSRLFRF
jgi:hypothetical protein